MDDKSKDTLEKIGEPNKVEIFPGIFFEDKLRIVTQRRLEKHFGLPITHIFPGRAEDPKTKEIVTWPGVDFNYLNNAVPLLTILAKQVNDSVSESDIEDALDNVEDENEIAEKIQNYMKEIASRKPKNRMMSAQQK